MSRPLPVSDGFTGALRKADPERLVEALDEWRAFWEKLVTRPVYVRWAFYYALLICLVVIGQWDQKQFVYMQF